MQNTPYSVLISTFNPDLQKLKLLLDECAKTDAPITIVDDGSKNLNALSQFLSAYTCTLLTTPTNKGLAARLNEGLAFNKKTGHQWVLIFDQDSLPCEGYFDRLNSIVENATDRKTVFASNVVLNGPAPAKGGDSENEFFESEYFITSGTLFPMHFFAENGLFDETFKVDYIDIELSLRARKRGWKIKTCKNASIQHSIGNMIRFEFLGYGFYSSNHSAERVFLRYKNRLTTSFRHFAFAPQFFMKDYLNSAKELAKIVIAEKQPAEKVSSAIYGIADAFGVHFNKF